MALPWGSRMPDLRVTVTRAFIVVFQAIPPRRPDLASGTRRLNRVDEHYTGHHRGAVFQGNTRSETVSQRPFRGASKRANPESRSKRGACIWIPGSGLRPAPERR